MIDAEKIWTTTDLNQFIYQKTRALCEADGFVQSPRRPKYLVRAGEHHVQIVRPDIYRSRTALCFGVSPAASFRQIILGEAKVSLRKDNNKDEFFNDYYMLALDPFVAKLAFDSGKMQAVWEEIVVPQLEEELFSVLRSFAFLRFAQLCENRRSGVLRCSPEPGIDDATHLFSKAQIRIWQGRREESIPLLEQAMAGYERHFLRCGTFGERELPEIREEYTAVGGLLAAVRKGEGVPEYLEELERTALNKTWGIARTADGQTVRLKKKELL